MLKWRFTTVLGLKFGSTLQPHNRVNKIVITEAKIKHSGGKNRTWLARKNIINERARFRHYPGWYFNQVGETISIHQLHKSFTLFSTLFRPGELVV